MVITMEPDLETALVERARKEGITPEGLALQVLRERFLKPQDEWEQRLHSAASDCGVSLSNEAVGSEGLYD